MTKDQILVVEDDLAIARGIIYNLEYEGYDVRHAAHGCAVMPIVGEFAPDLIVLDLMLPGRSGFDILRDLRHDRNDVYVIILSARTDEADKVEGLNLGADDYIAKPFALREFLARIASAMRRIRRQKQDETKAIVCGDLTIYPDDMSAMRGEVPIKLTPRACELLVFFAKHPNRTYSRDALIDNIWGDSYDGTNRTIDNFIVQIRAQIEENPSKPKRLETVHGFGYRFTV